MAGASDENYLLVAAIDFGTTFSGYAFSFKSSKDKPKLSEDIIMNKNWGAASGFQSFKTPTSVLTNKTGEFLAFGFEAEQRYGEALEDDDDEEPDMLMFRHFKMMLHNQQKINASAVLTSIDGTIMPALDVFSNAIGYLKDHLLAALKLQRGNLPALNLLRWVITVPAIWTDGSKSFMREAAFKAGCISDRNSKSLIIALEPEAASLCCRRLTIAQYSDDSGVSFPRGTKYLVLDCGGGTIDITMHVMRADDTVKEVLRASGGPWGGTEVDRNFIMLLESVFGKNYINAFRKRHPHEWLQFLTNFERTKKSFIPDGKAKIALTLPFTMGSLFAEMNKGKTIDKFLKGKGVNGVTFGNGMLIVKQEAAVKIFKPVVDSIVTHTRKLLRDPKADELRYIMMVGGFSDCQMLQDQIKETFEKNGVQVLIPSEAQMAIIKGAVLYGHKPAEIGSRIAKYSYGHEILQTFNPNTHDAKYKEIIDGHEECGQIFHSYVEEGDEINIGDVVKKFSCPLKANQDNVMILLYVKQGKPNKPVQYTDERDMFKVGKIRVNMTGYGLDRKVEISFKFGGTEIEVEAVELSTGNKETTSIDYLHQ